MHFFDIIKYIILIYQLYRIIKIFYKINPQAFKKILLFILFFIPFEITLLEDLIDYDSEIEEPVNEEVSNSKNKEKPKKNFIEKIDENMPTIFVVLLLSFLFYFFLDAFYFDSGDLDFPKGDLNNLNFDSDFDSDSDSLPKPPKRKIKRSGNPLNLYRYFHYMDAETGERIDDIDRLDPDTYEIVD